MAKQVRMSPKRKQRSSKGPSKAASAKGGRSSKVLGMSVPRTLANALESLVNSPRGREILAAAIVAAASAAAAALMEGSNKAEAAKARGAVSDAKDRITRDLSEAAAGVVAGFVSGAAQSLLPVGAGRKNDKPSGE